jgi:hypothetical protein
MLTAARLVCVQNFVYPCSMTFRMNLTTSRCGRSLYSDMVAASAGTCIARNVERLGTLILSYCGHEEVSIHIDFETQRNGKRPLCYCWLYVMVRVRT